MQLLRIGHRAMSSWLRPPLSCATPDLRALLRESFTHQPALPAVKIPRHLTRSATRALKPLLLHLNRKIEIESENDEKVILLDPEKLDQRSELLCPEAAAALEELAISLPPPSVPVDLTYEHYKLEHVLRVVLPESVKISAFSQIGHIAHLNLRAEALPYKFLIGQAILDKTKVVKTVVHKIDKIDSTYRNFQMELIAGEEDFIATQSANGCSFRMDFSKVYWNSRLNTEHSRLAAQLAPGDVLYDAFAGVGPFAVPAARKGCRVLANDLNPESARWLQSNVLLNSSRNSAMAISCFNMDARQFLKTAVAGDYRWEARRRGSSPGNQRFFLVMNLPALAVTFLDSLRYLPNPRQGLEGHWEDLPDLEVRCYCFLRDSTNEDAALKSPANEDAALKSPANEDVALKSPANEDAALKELELTKDNVQAVVRQKLRVRDVEDFQLHFVRNVAVSKNMYRLDFKVTSAMFREMSNVVAGRKGEPEAKKARRGDE